MRTQFKGQKQLNLHLCTYPQRVSGRNRPFVSQLRFHFWFSPHHWRLWILPAHSAWYCNMFQPHLAAEPVLHLIESRLAWSNFIIKNSLQMLFTLKVQGGMIQKQRHFDSSQSSAKPAILKAPVWKYIGVTWNIQRLQVYRVNLCSWTQVALGCSCSPDHIVL